MRTLKIEETAREKEHSGEKGRSESKGDRETEKSERWRGELMLEKV